MCTPNCLVQISLELCKRMSSHECFVCQNVFACVDASGSKTKCNDICTCTQIDKSVGITHETFFCNDQCRNMFVLKKARDCEVYVSLVKQLLSSGVLPTFRLSHGHGLSPQDKHILMRFEFVMFYCGHMMDTESFIELMSEDRKCGICHSIVDGVYLI